MSSFLSFLFGALAVYWIICIIIFIFFHPIKTVGFILKVIGGCFLAFCLIMLIL